MLNYKYGDRPYSFLYNSPIAATLAAIIVNPFEVIITRYALVDTTKKKLLFGVLLKRLWQREGLAGFYKGFGPEVIIKSLYFLTWMLVFQYMRDQYGVNLDWIVLFLKSLSYEISGKYIWWQAAVQQRRRGSGVPCLQFVVYRFLQFDLQTLNYLP